MKGFLLVCDGVSNALQMVIGWGALVAIVYLWWADTDFTWKIALMWFAIAGGATWIISIVYRVMTLPMRVEVVRQSLIQSHKDGLLTMEQRNDGLQVLGEGKAMHILFGASLIA